MNQKTVTSVPAPKKNLLTLWKEASLAQRLICLAIVAVGAIVLIFTSEAHAVSASGATLHTFFDQFWDEVKGLMTGSPAKAIMGFSILGTIAFSMIKPNLIGFLSCVVTILVLANAPTTIDGSLTVTVDALKALSTH